MKVAFDAQKGVAEVRGDSPLDRWPFTLDCSVGSAHIALDGVDFEVRPLAWRQKRLLARYSSLGAEFVRLQFLQLASAGSRVPDSAVAQEALLTLAMWINASGDAPAAVLHPAFLARVETDVCRSLGLRPGDLDQREAIDVEEVWSSLSRTTDFESAPVSIGTPPVPHAPVSTPLAGDVRRIRILPDPAPETAGTRAEADNPISAEPRPSTPEPAATGPAVLIDNPAPAEPGGAEFVAAAMPPAASPPSRPQFVPQATLRWSLARSRSPRGASKQPLQAATPTLQPTPEPVMREAGEPIALASVPQTDLAIRRSPSISTVPLRPVVVSAESPKAEPVQIEAPAAFTAPPIDVDALFDELSDRLEQAAANLGIEVGV